MPTILHSQGADPQLAKLISAVRLSRSHEYRGCKWTEIEPDVRRDWTQRHPALPFGGARESVRDSWEGAPLR